MQIVFQILCTQTDNLFSHFFEGNHDDKFDDRVQMIDGADNVFHCNVKELFWQYKLGTFLPNDLNEMATDVELDTFACGGGLIPAIESGVSGGSVGSALLSSYLTECFCFMWR